jgi:hypothetical protein
MNARTHSLHSPRGRMHTLRASLLLVPALLVAGAPGQVMAQDVRYETVNRVDMPGVAGTAMRLAARLGGGSLETVETTYISGRRMRTDAEKQSTIVDLENQRMLLLDHERKTYTSFTFQEAMDAFRQGTAQAAPGAGSARRESGDADAEVRFDFRMSVDAPGTRERISGYTAERFFVTMEAEGQASPEPGQRMEQAGTLVLLTEILASKDVPAFTATRAFTDASARDIAANASTLMDGIAAAFAEDPRMQVAFRQAAEEAQKIEGMPMKTVTRFVMVPPGQRFDRTAAVEPESAGRGGVAAAAGRAAIGGLRGRVAAAAGGRQQEEQPAANEAPKQATFMTVTSEVRNVSTARVDGSLFEIPAGYREVPLGGMN